MNYYSEGRGCTLSISFSSLDEASSINNSSDPNGGSPKMPACFARGRWPAGSSFSTRHPSAITSAVLRTNSPRQSLALGISQAAFVQLTNKSTERSFSAARNSEAPRNLKAAFLSLSHLGLSIALYRRGCSEALTAIMVMRGFYSVKVERST